MCILELLFTNSSKFTVLFCNFLCYVKKYVNIVKLQFLDTVPLKSVKKKTVYSVNYDLSKFFSFGIRDIIP